MAERRAFLLEFTVLPIAATLWRWSSQSDKNPRSCAVSVLWVLDDGPVEVQVGHSVSRFVMTSVSSHHARLHQSVGTLHLRSERADTHSALVSEAKMSWAAGTDEAKNRDE